MANQFKKKTEEEQVNPETVTNSGTGARFLKKINKSNLINKEKVLNQMPFIFFLTLLCLLYISNTYNAEKNIRDIDKINSELKELRSEYISTKSEFMFKSKQSEVAKAMSATGIKESIVPPRKIVLREKK